jgi:hypothetical protein
LRAAPSLLPPMPVIASATVITIIPVAGIVPRSVIRIPIRIDRSGVAVGRRRVAVGNWWSIIPIPRADDDGTYNSCPGPYNHPRAVPPMTPRVAWLREGQCYPRKDK